MIPFALPMALLIGLVGTLLYAAYFQAAQHQLVTVHIPGANRPTGALYRLHSGWAVCRQT